MPETWGDLPKSQIDPSTVDEEIDLKIATHEADPDAHLEVGESLQSHKASTIIDHLAKSIVEDKLDDGAISSRCITSDQIIGKDFRTSEDVGVDVDGVKFNDGGIEMWQAGLKKVNIPISGDPTFSGNIDVAFLTFSKQVLMTSFESLDGWFQDLDDGEVVKKFGGIVLYSPSVSGSGLFLGTQPETTRALDYSKHPLLQCMFEYYTTFNEIMRFGLGGDIYSDLGFAGFKVVSGVLYAECYNGTSRTTVNCGSITRLVSYILRVVYTSSTLVKFYKNGVLIATITTNVPTDNESFYFILELISTGHLGEKCGFINLLFVQDI